MFGAKTRKIERLDFILAGAQKSGTTALHYFLAAHPKITMGDQQEMHFFDDDAMFADSVDYEQLHKHYPRLAPSIIAGDCTPSYIYYEPAAERIWQYNRKIKLLVLLRNPVERAFSAWNMETKRGAEHISFEKAVEQEAARCREALPLQHRVFSYIDRGFYAHQVRRLFNIFAEDNCLVLLNEELRTEHEKALRKVFKFLKVKSDFIPPEASVFEQDYDQEINSELRSKLMDMFYYDIKELERLLHRDLSSWYA